MQEFKIIGHIDLPEKKIRPEDYRRFLESKMEGIQKEVNEEFSCKFLDEKGTIIMAESASLVADKKLAADLEQEWAFAQHKTVEQWRQSRDRNPSIITEMAVTLVLHKLLGERFIVARASSIDDYQNSVDHVLIDKQTGAIVCGFDEVLGFEGDDGGEKKEKKIKDNILRGGTTLKYGATIIDGKLVRKELKNIPTFFLSLSKEELNKNLADLKSTESKTENEIKLVHKLIASLESQYKEEEHIAVNAVLRENLVKFEKSLELIKQLLNYDQNQ